MARLDGFVEASQELEPFRCNPGHYGPSVLGFTASRDQATLFQAVKQSGYVRVPGNHAAGDFAARESLGRTAQDSQYVVLDPREVFGLENMDQAAPQHIRGAQQFEERDFLRRADGALAGFSLDGFLHRSSDYSLQR